mmetsp:Transcript_34791/g.39989  ORF Transcript_34791/g.39989 Transcript_34791/m.39989 type:complete len:206 (+) Transcript_34791:133-750(+)
MRMVLVLFLQPTQVDLSVTMQQQLLPQDEDLVSVVPMMLVLVLVAPVLSVIPPLVSLWVILLRETVRPPPPPHRSFHPPHPSSHHHHPHRQSVGSNIHHHLAMSHNTRLTSVGRDQNLIVRVHLTLRWYGILAWYTPRWVVDYYPDHTPRDKTNQPHIVARDKFYERHNPQRNTYRGVADIFAASVMRRCVWWDHSAAEEETYSR